MSIYYTQTTGNQEVKSPQFVDMEGLQLVLPPKRNGQTEALIMLNVPMPYAEGNNFPGITFGLAYNGMNVASGGFTYSQRTPESFARQPVTLIAKVDLVNGENSTVQAQWQNVRDSIGRIDSFASLSAIVS